MRHYFIVALFIVLVPVCAIGVESVFSGISPSLLLSQVGSSQQNPRVITNPDPGEVFQAGAAVQNGITWNKDNIPADNVMILWAKQNRDSQTGEWRPQTGWITPPSVVGNHSYVPNNGSYSWTIPAGPTPGFEWNPVTNSYEEKTITLVSGSDYLIQIFQYDPALGGNGAVSPPYDSDVFTINNSPAPKGTRDQCFNFGAAISSNGFDRDFSNFDRVLSDPANHYNAMVAENAMKFGPIHPRQGPNGYEFGDADKIANYARENNMIMRGHVFVWGFDSQNPGWLNGLNSQQQEVALREHITTVMTRYSDVVKYWDVVNEMTTTGTGRYWRIGGGGRENVTRRAFEIAREVADQIDPNIKLFYNDYNLYCGTGNRNNVKNLLGSWGPGLVDGIGAQVHDFCGDVTYSKINALINDFRDYEVHLTEIDIGGAPANEYTDALKACLDNDNCTSFMTWGVSDKYTWRNGNYLPFDNNFNPKSAMIAMRQVLANMNNTDRQMCNYTPQSITPPPIITPPVTPPSTVGDGMVSTATAATPAISSISPSSGQFGTRVVIVGSNFAAMNTVKINGQSVGQYSGTNNGTNIVISGVPYIGPGATPTDFAGDLRVQVVANNLNSNERVFRITPQTTPTTTPAVVSLPINSFLNNAGWKAATSTSGSSLTQRLTNWEWASVYQTASGLKANTNYKVKAKIDYSISDSSRYSTTSTGLFVASVGSQPGANTLCRDAYTIADANHQANFECTFNTGGNTSASVIIGQWLKDQRCRNTYTGTNGRSCYNAKSTVSDVTIEEVASLSWLRSGSLLMANAFQAITELFSER